MTTCKHCGLRIEIRPEKSNGWLHAEGLHEGKHTCAINPYGYAAEPMSERCSPACRARYELASEWWDKR